MTSPGELKRGEVTARINATLRFIESSESDLAAKGAMVRALEIIRLELLTDRGSCYHKGILILEKVKESRT